MNASATIPGALPPIPKGMPDWVAEVWAARKIRREPTTYIEYGRRYGVHRNTVGRLVQKWHDYQGRLQECQKTKEIVTHRATLEDVIGRTYQYLLKAENEFARVGYLRVLVDASEKLAQSYGHPTSTRQKPGDGEERVPVRTILLRGRDDKIIERLAISDN